MTKFDVVTINMFIAFIEIPQVQYFFVLGDVVIVRPKRHEIAAYVRNYPHIGTDVVKTTPKRLIIYSAIILLAERLARPVDRRR